MKTVKAGRPLIDLVKLAYQANLPLLLVGKHGVGKSQILEQAARELEIGFICRDLSLMEPPDLIGIPKIDGNVTRYYPPSFLPTGDSGILAFEELNRCPAYMRSPCLQLLTARQLNDYVLPRGWLPVAAINPPDEGYEVQELDQALLSRFVKVHVVANREEWLGWAKEHKIHTHVLQYVESDPKIFEDTNPRDWTYVSDVLHTDSSFTPVVEAVVAGLVGRERQVAFRTFIKSGGVVVPPIKDLLKNYTKHQDKVKGWRDSGQTDILDSLTHSLKALLQNQDNYEKIHRNEKLWQTLGVFMNDLPPDLCDGVMDYMRKCNYELPPGLRNHD